MAVLTSSFRDFPYTRRGKAGTIPQNGQQLLLPYSFLLIHWSSQHAKQNGLTYWPGCWTQHKYITNILINWLKLEVRLSSFLLAIRPHLQLPLTYGNPPRTDLRRSERPACSSCRYATAMRLATLLLPVSSGACFHTCPELSQNQTTFRCINYDSPHVDTPPLHSRYCSAL